MPSIPKPWKEKFAFVQYYTSPSELEFLNVWSPNIPMAPRSLRDASPDLELIKLCHDGALDPRRYSDPEDAHQLSLGRPLRMFLCSFLVT